MLGVFAAGMLLCCRPGWGTGGREPEGVSLHVLADAPASATAAEVAARPPGDWLPGAAGERLFPRAGQPLWARIRISNPGGSVLRGVLADGNLYADRVDLFEAVEQEGAITWQHQRAGEQVPGADKPLGGREAAFPLELAPGGERTVYLRIEDRFAIPSSLVWWPEQQAFLNFRARATFGSALYFGGLAVLLFYNGVLWLRLRFPDLGRYLRYLAGLAAFMFLSRNEWTALGGTVRSPAVETVTLLVLAVSLVFLVDFARVFLDLQRHAPRWDRVAGTLRGLALACAVLAPSLLWTRDATLFHATVLLGFLIQAVLLAGALRAGRKGAAQARYLAAAFAAFLIGLLPSLRMVFWPDARDETAVAGFALLAGSALELLLFSLATADRFTRLQQEKIAAEEALRREAEQREILQEAYADDLELEVRERTRELARANADKDRILTVLGHDLRSPLTGLARAAGHWESHAPREPGLGRFIAETARTSQELLLLIEDLVMWARLRAGTTTRESHPLAALVAPVVDLLQKQAAAAGIALTVTLPTDLMVMTDPVPLQSLLRNLIANALRAAGREVAVAASLSEHGVELTLRDDGPGLPPELLDALNTGDPGQLPVIHGLGLRLCLEISRALDLRLSVTSSNSGTGFHILLPRTLP